MAGFVGHGTDRHDLPRSAGRVAAKCGLQRVGIDREEPTRDRLAVEAASRGACGVWDAAVPPRDPVAMRPDPLGPTGAVDLGLQECHEINHTVIVAGIRDAVGTIVVESAPERVAARHEGDRIEHGGEQLGHA